MESRTNRYDANIQRQLLVNGEVLGRYDTMLNPDKPADSSGNPNFVTTANFNFGYTKIDDSSLWYLVAGVSAMGTLGAGGAALAFGAGNLAGQVAGNLMGMQSGINWTSVATSALGGAISSGLSSGPMAGSDWGMTVGRAAVGNALSQGIGVVTGLQKEFSWSGVAMAAVSAGVSYGMGEALGLTKGGEAVKGMDGMVKFGHDLISGVTTGMTVNALRGGRMTEMQVLTDAFGNALGRSFADKLSQPSQQEDKLGDFINEKLADQQQRDNPVAISTPVRGPGNIEVTDLPPLKQEPTLSFAEDTARRNAANNPMGLPVGGGGSWPRTYTVQLGDNPATIGRKFYGDERAGAAILADNDLSVSVKGARSLRPGTVLTLRDDIGEGNLRVGGNLIGADTAMRLRVSAQPTTSVSGVQAVLGYAASYPAFGQEVGVLNELMASGVMSPQQAQDALLASPRANMTLRSDYLPEGKPWTGHVMTAWDGVNRDPYAETRENMKMAIAAPVVAAPVVIAGMGFAASGLGALSSTVGPWGTAGLGFVTGGGMDAGMQYYDTGKVRPVQTLFAAGVGAISGPLGATSGFLTNVAVGAAGAALNTQFQNSWYNDDKSLGLPTVMGGAFGGLGYYGGAYTTKAVSFIKPETYYANPKVSALLQPLVVNKWPQITGVTMGGVVSGTAPFGEEGYKSRIPNKP